jgi:ubiquitin C-terminal hydrolase
MHQHHAFTNHNTPTANTDSVVIVDRMRHTYAYVLAVYARMRYTGCSLRAVSVHAGDAHGGHFVTYRQSPDDLHQWIYCSDTRLRRVEWAKVAAQGAYLLVYDRLFAAQSHVVAK